MKVWILTGSVHCGKTTFLTQWIERVKTSGNKNVFGVLSGPDDNEGRRHLTVLPSGECRRLQCSKTEVEEFQKQRESGAKDVKETVTIGPYTFFSDVMQWAKDSMAEAVNHIALSASSESGKTEDFFFILDEVGPLEINRGMGFEPFVSDFFKEGRLGSLPNVHMIVVVRQVMVDKFAAKYLGAPDAAAANVEFFNQECPIWRKYSEGVVANFPYIPPK